MVVFGGLPTHFTFPVSFFQVKTEIDPVCLFEMGNLVIVTIDVNSIAFSHALQDEKIREK